MSIIDSLIYDRTEADVYRVKELTEKTLFEGWDSLTAEEKAEYMNNPKGAYNAADMNRVGEAVEYVADQLTTLPVTIAAYLAANGVSPDPEFEVPYNPAEIVVTAKQNWTVASIPSQTDAANYLADIAVLYNAFSLIDAPTLPVSLDYFTYSMANDIERILVMVSEKAITFETEIKAKIDKAKLAFVYAGEFYCGEGVA